MASIWLAAYNQTLTAPGDTNGYATVADTSGFHKGAYVWLHSTIGGTSIRCGITEVVSHTVVRLNEAPDPNRNVPDYGGADLSSYIAGDIIFQHAQLVEQLPDEILPGDHKVKASHTDILPDVLGNKLVGTGSITITNTNIGGDEQLVIDTVDIADWSTTSSACRYFLVDYDGGNDSNVGYVDSTLGATIVPTGKAMKTLAAMKAILPAVGNDRSAVVLIKNRAAGAMYKESDGLTNASLDIGHLTGYHRFVIRGSSDLTNSATDKILCGGVTAVTGPNGDGSWSCVAGSTVNSIVTAGGLPAEPAALGYRIRFVGNITAGLANVCQMVHANSATTITTSADVAFAPALGDKFFIEKPGVQLAGLTIGSPAETNFWNRLSYTSYAPATGSSFASAAGFTISTGEFRSTSLYGMSFINVATGYYMDRHSVVHVSMDIYPDESGTMILTGTGTRISEPAAATNSLVNSEYCSILRNFCAIHSSSAFSLACFVGGTQSVVDIANSSIFWNMQLTVFSMGGAIDWSIGTRPTDPVTTRRNTRITSSGVAQGGRITIVGPGLENGTYATGGGLNNGIQNVDFTGSQTGIYIQQTGGALAIDGCTGTVTGDTPGIRIYSTGQRIMLGRRAANTLTGTTHTISVGITTATPTSIVTYPEIERCGFVDNSGNTICNFIHGTNPNGAIATETRYMTNASGVSITAGSIVRLSSTDSFTIAQADTEANSTNVLGVLLHTTANGSPGYVALFGSLAAVLFDVAAPSVGKVYLSAASAGVATTTPPAVAATNQKLRIGHCLRSFGSNYGLVYLRPEFMPILSDGNP